MTLRLEVVDEGGGECSWHVPEGVTLEGELAQHLVYVSMAVSADVTSAERTIARRQAAIDEEIADLLARDRVHLDASDGRPVWRLRKD